MDITPDCSMMDVDESEDSQLPQTQVGLAWQASQIPAFRVIAAQELFPPSKKRHRDQPTTVFQHSTHHEPSTPAASMSSTSHRVSTRPLKRTNSSTLELNPDAPVIDRNMLKIIASQVDEKTRRCNRQLTQESSKKTRKLRMSMPPPSSHLSTSRRSSTPMSSFAPDSPGSDTSMLSDCSMDIDSPSSLSASSFARDCLATSTQSSSRKIPPPSVAPHSVATKGHRATPNKQPGLSKPDAVSKQKISALPVKEQRVPTQTTPNEPSKQKVKLGAHPQSQNNPSIARSGPPPLGMRRAATTPMFTKQPAPQQKSFKPPLLPSVVPTPEVTTKKEEVDLPSSQDPDSSFDFGSFDEFDPELLDEVLSKVEEEKKRKKSSQ